MALYGLEGMKCHKCVEKITVALLDAGYKNVLVTRDPPSLQLEADFSVTKETLQEKLAEIGDYRLTATPGVHESHSE